MLNEYEEFMPTIVKNKYEIDENNKLIMLKGVTGVKDETKAKLSLAKNTAKATLAVSTAGLSLLSKKGRIRKENVDGGNMIIRLDEITGYDLLEYTGSRTDSKKSTNAGGAVTSLLGIGVGGAHIGSKGVSDNTSVIEAVSTQIKTNNLEHPIIDVQFLEGKTTRDTSAYKQGVNNANELIATLEMLKEKGLLGIQPESANEKDDLLSDDTVEKLKKLKELLDLGVLSQEEFDAKKAEILSK